MDDVFFEGVEKRVICRLSSKSDINLRKIPKEGWQAILNNASCTIMSETSNEYCTAYVLSESSLFVYEKEVIFKTCGSTTLLKIVPELKEIFDGELQSFVFTHLNYLTPSSQNFPHSTIEEEFKYLDETFSGYKYNLGPSEGGRYHMYIHNEFIEETTEKTYFEMQMFDLASSKMLQFYVKDNEDNMTNVSLRMTRESGIDNIFPGSIIDPYAFEPFGYSMNGLFGEYYWTIHITPQKKCSYVSFETNCTPELYHELIKKVIDIFRPSSFNINILSKSKESATKIDAIQDQLENIDGFYLMESAEAKKPGVQKTWSLSFSIAKSILSNIDSYETDKLTKINIGDFLSYIERMTGISVEMQPNDFNMINKLKELTQRTSLVQDSDEKIYNNDSFYIIDIGQIVRKINEWKEHLPMVQPFYAMKCNPDDAIIVALSTLGVSFDSASMNEIKKILSYDIESDRIIYANPCKSESHIKYAKDNNVKMMTVDNEEELIKIKNIFPDAHIIVRLKIDDPTAQCPLGFKYGATVEEIHDILAKAKELQLDIRGVSFHAGSGIRNPEIYASAIETSAKIINDAKLYGFNMKLLDIGGGYTDSTFTSIAKIVKESITKFVPFHIEIISEPGRFIVSSGLTLATRIFSKRYNKKDNSYFYYVGDGLYGSFNCLMYDHVIAYPKILKTPESNELFNTTIFGNTCDALDCICENIKLPNLEIGDWLYFNDFGAYTVASASNFNGFDKPDVYYIYSD